MIVARLYAERYGDLDGLEAERRTPELPPPGAPGLYGCLPPITREQAARNWSILAAMAEDMPACVICWQEARTHRAADAADRTHHYTPAGKAI